MNRMDILRLLEINVIYSVFHFFRDTCASTFGQLLINIRFEKLILFAGRAKLEKLSQTNV